VWAGKRQRPRARKRAGCTEGPFRPDGRGLASDRSGCHTRRAGRGRKVSIVTSSTFGAAGARPRLPSGSSDRRATTRGGDQGTQGEGPPSVLDETRINRFCQSPFICQNRVAVRYTRLAIL